MACGPWELEQVINLSKVAALSQFILNAILTLIFKPPTNALATAYTME